MTNWRPPLAAPFFDRCYIFARTQRGGNEEEEEEGEEKKYRWYSLEKANLSETSSVMKYAGKLGKE